MSGETLQCAFPQWNRASVFPQRNADRVVPLDWTPNAVGLAKLLVFRDRILGVHALTSMGYRSTAGEEFFCEVEVAEQAALGGEMVNAVPKKKTHPYAG